MLEDDLALLETEPWSTHRLDVTDPAEVAELVTELGEVDILVNSSGVVGPNMAVWDVSDQDWARIVNIDSCCDRHADERRHRGRGARLHDLEDPDGANGRT